jgi:hypothetical protein
VSLYLLGLAHQTTLSPLLLFGRVELCTGFIVVNSVVSIADRRKVKWDLNIPFHRVQIPLDLAPVGNRYHCSNLRQLAVDAPLQNKTGILGPGLVPESPFCFAVESIESHDGQGTRRRFA